ncbi:MAG: hypothetical protein DCO97_11000 [Marivita sp. XM-24bin2]|jgi:hypothetical protein|nr:MAG: hypothetical protein DCO97_11000 [Marivita sp. XM-24bin2]
MFSAMSFNLNLRFLGVFQPDTKIGKRFACLTPRSGFSGLHLAAQRRHHLADGPQLLRNGIALGLKRATRLFCSDLNHAIPASSC